VKLSHAGAATASIRVWCEDGALRVEVTDTGPADTVEGVGAPVEADGGARNGAYGGGHGIRGIRAQAEALGGTLHAGPRPAGGFAVEARLPTHGGKGR